MDTPGRVERTTRLAGGLLLAGSILTYYAVEALFMRSPSTAPLLVGYQLAARVMAPAGAMLMATSLATRALTAPYRRPSARMQLVAGLTLFAVGLLQSAYGPQIVAAMSEGLGATANAGIFVLELLARVLGLTALPIGLALLAIQPLVRNAANWHLYALGAGPPDVESL